MQKQFLIKLTSENWNFDMTPADVLNTLICDSAQFPNLVIGHPVEVPVNTGEQITIHLERWELKSVSKAITLLRCEDRDDLKDISGTADLEKRILQICREHGIENY